MTHRLFLRGFGILGFVLAVAACQSNEPTSQISDVKNGQLQPPSAQVQESDLRAYCPAVTLREGTAIFRTYARGGEGDPQKLAFQASIADVTRSCSRNETHMTLNIAAAGRVVTGPSFAGSSVTLPIRVAIVRGNEVLYSQLHRLPVNVANPAAATQFVMTDPAAVIPLPEPGTIRVYVGFDEGPTSSTRR